MKKGEPNETKAREWAQICHSGQLYANETPYSTHLDQVAAVCRRFGDSSPEMMSAAQLHDALEDTDCSYNDVNSRFGRVVAEMVYAVTSDKGRNRKERNAKTYPEIRNAGKYFDSELNVVVNLNLGQRATFLKLADRIANVEYGAATNGKNDMYAKEFAAFEEALRWTEDEWGDKFILYKELEPMWAHLSKLLRESK